MSRLLDLFFPKRCIMCSRILPWGQKEQHCTFCNPEKWLLTGARCRLCSRPVGAEGGICRSCLVHQITVPGYSLLNYDGMVRDSIHRFKYEGQKGYAAEYADWICRYASHVLEKTSLLIPVPIHKRRHAERGYNQAEELAKGLSAISGIPYSNRLLRNRHTAPQNALTARGRRKNVQGAFEINDKAEYTNIEMLPDGDIVLVDDIYTSGSTIEEAAAVLKGVYTNRTIRFLTVAMAMEEELHDEM